MRRTGKTHQRYLPASTYQWQSMRWKGSTGRAGLGEKRSCSSLCTHTTASTLPDSSMLIAICVTMPVHCAPASGGVLSAYIISSCTPKCRSSRLSRSLRRRRTVQEQLGLPRKTASCAHGDQGRTDFVHAPVLLAFQSSTYLTHSALYVQHALWRVATRVKLTDSVPSPRKAQASFTCAT